MAHLISRRRFLQASSAITTLGRWNRLPAATGRTASANERLCVGVIGLSNRGGKNLKEIAACATEVVALCDVDENRAVQARGQFPRAQFYTDFRRLIDHKGLDAVVVSTPDHTHAVATAAALRAGLHVYCEKPLAHTVHEARVVAELAAKHKRVTQMGTQIHAGKNYRRVVELVRSGAIGAVDEVHVWCVKSISGGNRPKDAPPVPTGLHYDLWLGPAPYRPYHPAYVPYNWRGWWDFGGGTLADMACHYVDLAFWALKLRAPTRVRGEGPRVHLESTPPWLIVRYDFPCRGELPPVRLTWYDGGKRPPSIAEGKVPKWENGVLFVGEKGMLIADYERYRLLPEKEFEGFRPPAPSIAVSVGHHKEWVDACKTGGPTTCNFAYGGALTEAVLLGNVAYRTGRPLEWDAAKLCAVNAPDAEKYLRHEYRKPWTL